jgi:hypothetical protein
MVLLGSDFAHNAEERSRLIAISTDEIDCMRLELSACARFALLAFVLRGGFQPASH